jgi:hypothetical protein
MTMQGKTRRSLIAVAAAGAAMSSGLSVAVSAHATVQANNQSHNFAGWGGNSANGFTKAGAKITIPALTCPSGGPYNYQVEVTWNGFQVSGGGSGTADLTVAISCYNGALSIYGWVGESDTTGSSLRYLNVAPGDTLSAAISLTSHGFQISGRNVTTGESWTVQGYTPSLQWFSANYGVRSSSTGPSGSQPVPTFTAFKFSSLTIDNHPAGPALSLTGYDLYNGADVLVQASGFNSKGNGYSDKFVASS